MKEERQLWHYFPRAESPRAACFQIICISGRPGAYDPAGK
jgi:hypothetical protein